MNPVLPASGAWPPLPGIRAQGQAHFGVPHALTLVEIIVPVLPQALFGPKATIHMQRAGLQVRATLYH